LLEAGLGQGVILDLARRRFLAHAENGILTETNALRPGHAGEKHSVR
jgi:hypothetical protein